MFADVNHRDVFEYFSKICSIPHGSGNTKGIADYLCGFAVENNLKFYRDDMNNVIIYKNCYHYNVSAGIMEKTMGL